MRHQPGTFSLGQWYGVPVRMHWLAPIGALVLAGISRAWWGAPCLLILTLVHELGHAYFVRRYEHEVIRVDLQFMHGLCCYAGHTTDYERAVIAWGGVLFQAPFLLVALALSTLPVQSSILAGVIWAFGVFNLFSIIFNLLPIAPLDGHRAWELVPMLQASMRTQRAPKKKPRKKKTPKKSPAPRVPVYVPEDPHAAVDDESKALVDQVLGEALKKAREKRED